MAENKKTFIFYSDWINMIREMDNEDAGELLKHILSYVNDENPITENKFVRMAFGHMKPLLKKDLDKWDKQLKKYSDMGKLSAQKRAKKRVEPALTYVEHTSTVNDNVNVNVNDNVNNIENGIPFDSFWNLYDKKIGNKKSCSKKWDKLTKELQEDVLIHVKDYVISTPDKMYRANPETYFNQKRWENEIIGKKESKVKIIESEW